MRPRIKPRLTYGNVVSSIALFVVTTPKLKGEAVKAAMPSGPSGIRSKVLGLLAIYLAIGGVASGASLPPNSVKSKHIQNRHVRTPDLRAAAVKRAKLAPNAVDSARVADDALTGSDIDELALSFAVLQRRLEGACPAGEAIRAVAQDGSLSCEGIDGGGSPNGPAGGDLAGSYPNPTIGVPLTLAGSSGGTPTLTASQSGAFGVGLLGSGYWGVFGSSESADGGASGVAALATGAGGHGLTATATGGGGTGVDVQASGAAGVALEARAAGAATKAADFAGRVDVTGSSAGGLLAAENANGSSDVSAVRGSAIEGFGVHGLGSGAQGTGVLGEASGEFGRGVRGVASGTSGTGVLAEASDVGGTGLVARGATDASLAADIEGLVEIEGRSLPGPDGPSAAVNVTNTASFSAPIGIQGTADAWGLRGEGAVAGVRGVGTFGGTGVEAFGTGFGVEAVADGNFGRALYADVGASPNALAAELRGDVWIRDDEDSSDLTVDGDVDIGGTLTKAAGSFRIDHPLDPADRYLSHSFVESPEMKNVYDGIVTTDGAGFATVAMPVWFDALNRRFRYQLTVLGRGFARAVVWRELDRNRFRIRTNRPRVKVSWQVTGVRDDAYALANPLSVVERKRGAERGRYLHPELHGAPGRLRIGDG